MVSAPLGVAVRFYRGMRAIMCRQITGVTIFPAIAKLNGLRGRADR